AGFGSLTSFIDGWIYEGPGVWTGDDFDAFFHGDAPLEREFVAVLGAARDRVNTVGDVVPIDRRRNGLGHPFREPSPVDGFIRAIDGLRDLFPILDVEIASKGALEVMWTSGRKGRAEIVRRDDGLFQILLYREVRGDGEWEPDVYWSPVGREAILTDTL